MTCANDKEAKLISQALLKKKLIVCVKRFPVSSSFLWKGKIGSAEEVLLMMESEESKFRLVEEEVKRLHSYETIVLFSLTVSQTTKGVKEWLKDSLR